MFVATIVVSTAVIARENPENGTVEPAPRMLVRQDASPQEAKPAEPPQEKTEPNDEKKQAEEQESKQDESAKKEPEKEATEDGSDDLDEASRLKITAQSTRDLDRVVDLLESALTKGLDGDSKDLANQLLTSTLYEHADLLSKRIFATGGSDRRWRQFRREALTRLDRAVELDPKMGPAYQLIAQLNALPGGDKDKAHEAIEKAVELAGDDKERLSKALLTRATLAEDKETMLADLAQAIKIDPENTDAIQARGKFYLRTGEPEKAIADLKLWLESDKNNMAAYQDVANSLRDLGKYDEAIEIIDSAIAIEPDNAENFVIRSDLNVNRKKYDEAVEDANKALKLDRKLFVARLTRAEALLMKNKLDDALEDVNQVLDDEPLLVAGIELRSRILTAKGDFSAAIEDMKTLSDNYPESLGFRLQLAQLYNADDQPRRAIRIYNRVLNSISEGERGDELRRLILRGRGDARLSLGQHKEAIEDYDEALELAPDDDGILNNLAWVLATSPVDELRNGKRAIELAKKACEETDYKMPHILSTLASGYAEEGDFDKAIEWIQKAIQVNEADSEENKDEDQTTFKEQHESLEKELASYEKKEPWREIQNVEAEKKSDDSEEGDDEAAGDDQKSDDKKSDDKANKKADEEGSAKGNPDSEKKGDNGKQGGGEDKKEGGG